MSNFNELFDSFPDYDVFDPNNKEIKSSRMEKVYGNNDFIEYDEKRDFRNKKPIHQQQVHRQIPVEEPEQEPEHSADYGDDFGIYKIYENKIKNYATIFFFPLSILWLECGLRLGCGETLFSFNMVFVVLFSLSFSAVLTTFCTLFPERLNRVMVKILLFMLTIWYCTQLVHFGLTQSFITFSSFRFELPGTSEIEKIMDMMSDKVYFLLMCFVPFVFNLFVGKYIFPFRKIQIPAKICLVLVAVLLHFSAVTLISFDKNSENPLSNYSVYHESNNSNALQEKFGLYTMQIKTSGNMEKK